MEGISITKLLVIGALIVLLFGTNKLRTLGSDLGSAIKGFKRSMKEDDKLDTEANEQSVNKVSHKE